MDRRERKHSSLAHQVWSGQRSCHRPRMHSYYPWTMTHLKLIGWKLRMNQSKTVDLQGRNQWPPNEEKGLDLTRNLCK
jgi:hypothetical protein